jgi:nitroreductase
MDFFETLKARHSIRKYVEGAKVEESSLQTILEACNAAPSAGNLQGYRIIVVRSDDQKSAVAEAAYGQTFITNAGVLLAFVADFSVSAERYGDRAQLYAIQDASIAATVACYAATDLGLGTCWIGAFDDDQMAKVLGVPEGSRPVAIIAVGKPDQSPSGRSRRPLDDIAREGKYDGPGFGGA